MCPKMTEHVLYDFVTMLVIFLLTLQHSHYTL